MWSRSRSVAASPQAFGWFKRPIKDLADFKGLKCRQTGIVAEIYQRMGMQTVNLPGGEIVPSAQRGVIDCAEWVGGIEDLRLGLPQVWKYHYTPGMHESNSMRELIINSDVWKSFTPQQQEAIRVGDIGDVRPLVGEVAEAERRRDRGNAHQARHPASADAARYPDRVSSRPGTRSPTEESAKNPFFKKVLDSQRAYASKVVPAKRFMFPPYSFAANYYWPEKK